MHSFHAFIDESGDEGFKIKPFPDKGSSEWFVLSACVVRGTELAAASRQFKTFLDPVEAERQSPAHFVSLTHECRVGFSFALAKLPITVISICIHKGALGAPGPFEEDRRMHFYAMRFLMERISWIARDRRRTGEGNGKCQLVFSRCKGLAYDKLGEYFGTLQAANTSVHWPALDVANMRVKGHEESIWLRATDAIASGVAKGLELSPHGYCEPRYAATLQPITYRYGTKYLGYGLKFFPQIPAVEVERDNRYEWLSLYK